MKSRHVIAYLIVLITSAFQAHAENAVEVYPDEMNDECRMDLAQVRVTIDDVNDGGLLTVELYNDPKNFLSSKGRVKRIRVPATAGSHEVCFDLATQGTYAVAAYHDVDGNRKLNRKWNKMPKEPFGLSLNPKLKFGFPKFSKSAFETDDKGADINITLHNP
jgi:uncharacterized protein (DUF2141 family)